ncbi:hypothetical protein LINPERPRIM_LOCUS22012 [Linum perenne]
MTSSVFLKNV